jgi:type IV secretory pathway TrbD component
MRYHDAPVNDALNKSKYKGGLPWQLWLLCVVIAGAVMARISIPFGAVLFFLLSTTLVLFFRIDERVFEIARCSIAQKSYYDPGKAE